MLDRLRRHFFLTTVIVLVVIVVAHENSRRFFAYSSDAFVTADTVTLAPAVAGLLAELHVTDNQAVLASDVLFALDEDPFQYSLALAKAEESLAQAEVQTAKDQLKIYESQEAAAQATFEDASDTERRVADLTEKGFATEQRLENLRRDLATASAALDQAKAAIIVGQDTLQQSTATAQKAAAEVSLANYNLARATVYAPQDGTVAPFTTRIGDYVDVGDPVLTLVTNDNWRIVVNLPEQHLARTRVGNKVYFMLSSQPWRIYEGKVRSIARGISRAEVPVATLPYVEPTTNWIRLSRRFPVEVDMGTLPDDLTLFMGADVRVLIVH